MVKSAGDMESEDTGNVMENCESEIWQGSVVEDEGCPMMVAII